jgi:hypothetical protein
MSRALIALAFLGALLAVLATGLDTYARTGEWRNSVFLLPRLSPGYQAAEAQRLIQEGDYQGAEIRVRRALALEPLNQSALRNLAFLLERRHEGVAAARVYRAAALLGWRDPHVNAALFRSAFDRRDFAQAAARLDALLRTERLAEFANPAGLELEQEPEARRALARRLASAPPWRERYLRQVNTLDDRQLYARHLLLRELAAQGSASSPATAGYVARALLRRGRPDEAHALWMTSTGSAQEGQSLVFDGSFELPAGYRQPPFGWELRESSGARAEVEAVGGGGSALHVVTESGSATPVASQWLLLRSGRYRIDVRVLRGATASIEPNLECLDRRRVRLNSTIEGAVTFSVPDHPGCRAQRLVLYVRAAGSGATAAIDEVAIRRIP